MQFPDSAAALLDLPGGTADTTLSGAIDDNDVSLVVATLPAGVTAAPFVCRIGAELILVGAIGGTGNKTWSSLTRGYSVSDPAAHASSDDVWLVWAGVHIGGHADVLLRDEKAQNTSGGTFTLGAWRTRDLNTEVYDPSGYASLASNQFTLQPGTYDIEVAAPAFNVGNHQIRLQNVTDGTTLVIGQQLYTYTANSTGFALLTGRFTVAAGKALEIQHRADGTVATNGFGAAANLTTEVYTVVRLWRVA